MRTKTIKIYTIEEHPNPEKCFQWIRDNWHDLGQHCVDEMVDSLKALAKEIDGELNYSLSIVPDRDEHVSIKEFDADKLEKLYKKRDECPLTGVCYDHDVIEALHDGDLASAILKTLHAEGEHLSSDDGLREMCEANNYEFNETGKFER